MIRRILVAMVLVAGLFFSKAAHATHFRYGNVTWKVTNPNAPLAVTFTVTTAWRTTQIGATRLFFGDGADNGTLQGAQIGTGFDSLGQQYTVMQYQATHTYAVAGNYIAFFQGNARIAGLINGSLASYRVDTQVGLFPGDNASPVSSSPALIQQQAGGVRTYTFPAFDADGDPVTCRFATTLEMWSQNPTDPAPPPPAENIPTVPANNAMPTLMNTAAGCVMTWDLSQAVAGQQYVIHLVFESTHGGHVSSTAIDLMDEIVSPPVPTCAGSGTFVLNVGQNFSTMTTGTNGVNTLTVTSVGMPAGSSLAPVSGSSGASPFPATFSWNPGAGAAGTTNIVQINYTNAQNLTGTCFLTLQVAQCPGYGVACTAGVGACQANGIQICTGPNSTMCNAIAGSPTPEICDGIDNNCNGMTDEGNPGGGAACSTGLLGVCAAGTTTCSGGALSCAQNVQASAETCDNKDNNCNGQTDEGNPGGGAACSTGLLGVCAAGTTTCNSGALSCAQNVQPSAEVCDNKDNNCDGQVDEGNPGGGAACATGLPGVCATGLNQCSNGALSCVPAIQPGTQVDVCNGLDDDCNGQTDQGFNVGMVCSAGIGACLATGSIVCDGLGGAKCSAVPGLPVTEVCGDLIDNDCDGQIDEGCGGTDTDGDGLSDAVELLIGTDPNDADSDDDGVPDGQEINPGVDTDGDGLINALDPDSDDDGLLDGTEMGFDCSNAATDLSKHHCVPDGDLGATKTDPLDPDTDHGGASDGSEDANLNGVIDPGETDPTLGHGADDSTVVDTDGDGLGDNLELTLGTDPNDADSDDDGVIDGKEPNPSLDMDGDGLIDALDPDSDNDGLFDGTEMGFDCNNPATDNTKGWCTPDGDLGATKTSPVDPDTDHGGATDGSEDSNLNGVIDPGETDPTATHGGDDSAVVDTDGDGLGDDLEATLGTNPNDADSDDDGVIDGLEPNPSADMDGDGLIDALDPDSDGDGLFDGTEMGFDCSNAATDNSKNQCIADGDHGATKTGPLDPDTDDGGVKDGVEDANHNGVVDPGERDPNKKSDDAVTQECADDSDCGGLNSGMVCDDATHTCIEGCRGMGGNGCPTDVFVCTSDDTTIGQCVQCVSDDNCGSMTSGKVCDDATHTCIDGCRGSNGNTCPGGKLCTSLDPSIGMCVGCLADSDCGTATSGKICDDGTHACIDGCRSSDGNDCPSGKICDIAAGASAGKCVADDDDGVVAQGNGILCAARPANDNGDALWLAGIAIAIAARRRRKAV